MGFAAAIVGAIGGLCAVIGIVTAAEVTIPLISAGFTSMFWLSLATVLLLGCIAAALSRNQYE